MIPERVRLWTLELEGQPLALILNLLAGPREHGLLMAYGDTHAKLAPGNALQHHAIVAAIAEGRTELDLGPGQDPYKYRLGAIDRTMLRARVLSPTLPGRINGAIATLDLTLRNSAAADILRRRRGLTPAQEKATAPRD